MWRADLRTCLLSLAVLLTGCEIGIPAGSEPFRELNWINMADQPKLKPQRPDIFGARGVGEIAPPEGAVAVGAEPYPFVKEEADLAGASLTNPLAATPENLKKGAWIYTNFCAVCHGATGAGDGPLTKKFPAPPSLHRQKVRDWPDGRLFHNPMRGQNSMPALSRQISQEEAWAAVLWVRKLQSENPVAPPTAADLAAMPAVVPDPAGTEPGASPGAAVPAADPTAAPAPQK